MITTVESIVLICESVLFLILHATKIILQVNHNMKCEQLTKRMSIGIAKKNCKWKTSHDNLRRTAYWLAYLNLKFAVNPNAIVLIQCDRFDNFLLE